MSRPLTRRQIGIVRENHHRCEGFVVAASGECFEVQRKETWGPDSRVPGRRFQPIHPDTLGDIELPRSWFMGILLCPGDSVESVVVWYRQLPISDRSRVKFYLHPDFDRNTAADSFSGAEVASVRVIVFAGAWENFHPLFGYDHALQVLADFGAGRTDE